jgi:curli biogenesis system outer membrane secretion channel CsgG
MNPKRSLLVVTIALVAVIANVFSVFAYPAEMPEVTPAQNQPNACQLNAAASAQIDIPAHRSDYNALDRVAKCTMTGFKVDAAIIPVTGAPTSKYAAFKELQADLMSGQ